MITCYFGVPGVGKTTLLVKLARQELKRIALGKSKYSRVYTNFDCSGCYKIAFNDLASFKIYDALILLDELMLDADNRNFKQFPIGIRDFLTLHRKVGCDIVYVTQAYDKVDTKIRALTQDLWYMSRSVVPLLSEFTMARRIYRTISITEMNGELIMGYRFCNFLEKLFARNTHIVFRRFYYKYFDSYDEDKLKEREVLSSVVWRPEKTSDVLNGLNLLSFDTLLRKVKIKP